MSTEFNYTDVNGKQIVIETPVLDALTAIVTDKSVPAERRDLAAKILRYAAQRAKSVEGMSEPDRAAHLWLVEEDAKSLWNNPDYRLKTVTENGNEMLTLDIESSTPNPVPRSVVSQCDVPQTFSPAVPLPIRPVEPVELQARSESDARLAEHYSPAAIEKRLQALAKETEILRALRNAEGV